MLVVGIRLILSVLGLNLKKFKDIISIPKIKRIIIILLLSATYIIFETNLAGYDIL
jgi:hypothetical protein